MTPRILTAGAAALALTSASLAYAAGPAPSFNRTGMDTTCSPCRDFDQFVNGGWKRTSKIPPSMANWGSFTELAERNRSELRRILEEAAATQAAPASGTAKLGTYYSTCMDSVAAEKAGTQPIQPLLSAIDAMKDRGELAAQVAWMHAHGVRGALFSLAGMPDRRNSDMTIANLGQGGIGLPDRDYYFRTDSSSNAVRTEYLGHIARMFQLVGRPEASARSAADRIYAIEKSLASASMTNVQRRDPDATYHKLPLDSLRAMTPSFDWGVYLSKRMLRIDSLNVQQPAFFRALDGIVTGTPLADWQDYLRWRVLEDAAPTLSSPFVNEDFRYGRILTGVKELPPRWKRCVQSTDQELGDLLGQAYVKRNFPPEARERALRLVRNLEATLSEHLAALDWMSDATRAAARGKLDAFANKIGYPDTWRDYAALEVRPGPFFANRIAARTAETTRLTAKIGKPVDRGEWFMTAPTVNAFYSASLNSINFPAGILQPPFFDPSWDDALNYGGIGVVIGHEMTHGFDDQGRKFDAKGNLRDWWTPQDAKNYQQRSDKIADQYSSYTVLDTLHLNGRLTLGENTADIGGVALAYAALERELASKPRPGPIDGFTPEQRFFLSHARVWRSLQRDEALRQLVLTNPHSPAHWRVNGPLSVLDEFARAFGCKPGDPMVAQEEKRSRIW
jgi:putative endopeptidase